MLILVPTPVTPSVGAPPSIRPCSRLRPSGSFSERLRRKTPEKMTRNPQRRETVLTLLVVLKPLKRMKEARRTAVVKVT